MGLDLIESKVLGDIKVLISTLDMFTNVNLSVYFNLSHISGLGT